MELVGANLSATPAAEDRQITRTNYFLGNDPTRWHTGIPNYGRVRYQSIYPGIDLVYYGNQRRLEHDFLVTPKADPAQIAFTLGDGKKARLDPASGDLVLTLGGNRTLRLLKPVSYQQAGSRHIPVASSYRLLPGHRIGFAVGSYNHRQPLVIDPVLVYSTYLGGSSPINDQGDSAQAIQLDASGNLYIAGSTQSLDFPVTSGAYQTTNQGAASNVRRNAFIAKLNPTGTQLLFSTYLGGSDNGVDLDSYSGDAATGIAVDSNDNVYVTGNSWSTDFPTTAGAFQTVNYNGIASGHGGPSAFVTKLNASGTALVYSTYLGGHAAFYANGDHSAGIAVDSSGNAYIAGTTDSPDFPVTSGAFQTTLGSANSAFVTKLNPTGTALVYSTYLGQPGASTTADGQTSTAALALDSADNVYVAGVSASATFPVTSGAFQTVNHNTLYGDPFLSKLNSTGTALIYSTFLGGSLGCINYDCYYGDTVKGLALDASGRAYLAGTAVSLNFPIQGGLQEPYQIGGSGFVARLNADASSLDYSTLVGGNNASVSGVAVDSQGDAFAIGYADPSYLPITPDGTLITKTTNSFSINKSPNGAFIAKLNSTGDAVKYASEFGGTDYDLANAIQVDATGNAYLAGATYSGNFPVTSGAFQTVDRALFEYGVYQSSQAFASKLSLADATSDHLLTSLALTSTAASFTQGTSVPITVTAHSAASAAATGTITLTVASNSPSSFAPVTASIGEDGVATFNLSTLAPGNYTFCATYPGDGAHLSANSCPQADGTLAIEIIGGAAKLSWFYDIKGPVQYNQIFGGFSFGATVTDSVGNPVQGTTVVFSGTGLTFASTSAVTDSAGHAEGVFYASKIGSYTLKASVASIPAQITDPFKVVPVPLEVTLKNASRIYGAATPTIPYVLTGLVNGDTVTVTPSTAGPTAPVGTYPITATVSGAAASNYTITVDPATLTVKQAPLHVAARNVSVVYGHVPSAPAAYLLTGFLNGDTAAVVSGAPTLSTNVTATSPVGFYPITVGTGTLTAQNYYIISTSNGEGAVQVTKAPLHIHPASYTIHAGDALPAFAYSLTGFVNGDTQATATTGSANITTTATPPTKFGHYYITGAQGSLQSQNYYFLSYVEDYGFLTVLR
jgi:hypothetical protein